MPSLSVSTSAFHESSQNSRRLLADLTDCRVRTIPSAAGHKPVSTPPRTNFELHEPKAAHGRCSFAQQRKLYSPIESRRCSSAKPTPESHAARTGDQLTLERLNGHTLKK